MKTRGLREVNYTLTSHVYWILNARAINVIEDFVKDYKKANYVVITQIVILE